MTAARSATPGPDGPGVAASTAGALPPGVETELTRIERRWSQLSVDAAGRAVPELRRLAARLAGLTDPGVPLPQASEAALPAQLRVVAYDALLAGRIGAQEAQDALARVRRELP